VEPRGFTPLLSFTADFCQKWQPSMLIPPRTNRLHPPFDIRAQTTKKPTFSERSLLRPSLVTKKRIRSGTTTASQLLPCTDTERAESLSKIMPGVGEIETFIAKGEIRDAIFAHSDSDAVPIME
jgi:hypothetical protein